MKKRAALFLLLIPVALLLRPPAPPPPPAPLTPPAEALLSVLELPCEADCAEAVARLDAIEALDLAALPPDTHLIPLLPIIEAWRDVGDAAALIRLVALGQRMQTTSTDLSGYIIGQQAEEAALVALSEQAEALSGGDREALAALLTPDETTRPAAAIARSCDAMAAALSRDAAELRLLNRLLYRSGTAARFLHDRCDGLSSHAARGTPLPEDPQLELWNVVPWFVVSSLSDTAVAAIPALLEGTEALDTRRTGLLASL